MSSTHAHCLSGSAFSRRRSRGLTMIECLCAVSVLATTLGMVAPGMQSWHLKQALLATAAELETDIHYARSEAVARQQSVRLETQTLGRSTCYVLHTGAAHDCICSGNGQAQCSGDAVALRVAEQRDDGAVQLATTNTLIAFDPSRGTVTPTATLRLVDKQGRAIHLVVNIMGRPRSCSPQAQISGLKPC